MKINPFFKKVFVYLFISVVVCFVLIFLNFVKSEILEVAPNFSDWAISVILALIVGVGILLIWNKIRETALLKDEFIAVIMHRLRTPLTTIKWASSSLANNATDEQKTNINQIEISANRLVDLTNIVANISISDESIFGYNFIKLNINNLLESLLFEYEEKIKAKNISLHTALDSDNYIFADEEKIKFVFQTLIDNAINYTPESGKVSFELSAPTKNNVIIKISDTGIGMSEEQLKLLFKKFYRTSESRRADKEGMGIGLYITKKIVEKHDGKIWAKSDGHEKGSTFFVSFPVCKK